MSANNAHRTPVPVQQYILLYGIEKVAGPASYAVMRWKQQELKRTGNYNLKPFKIKIHG